jgi:hypothetical protein
MGDAVAGAAVAGDAAVVAVATDAAAGGASVARSSSGTKGRMWRAVVDVTAA